MLCAALQPAPVACSGVARRSRAHGSSCSSDRALGAAAAPAVVSGRQPQQQQRRRRQPLARALPSPSSDVISASDQARLDDLREMFRMADLDGNGTIDRTELQQLLSSVERGRAYPLVLDMQGNGWLPEEAVDEAMTRYDKDKSGDIDFEEFQQLVYDGLLLEGTICEYEAAFAAVDKSGDGRIGATELSALFSALGAPLSAEKVAQVFIKYDKDESGQIDFTEFLLMFRDQLLDLRQVQAWVAASGGSTGGSDGGQTYDGMLKAMLGTVNVVLSGEELEEVLRQHRARLVVMFAGVSWCRPCKGVAKPYQTLAAHYRDVLFLKLIGNANPSCKEAFKRLKIRTTPSFLLFREGELVGSSSGAKKERLEENLRAALTPAELEGIDALFDAPAPVPAGAPASK